MNVCTKNKAQAVFYEYALIVLVGMFALVTVALLFFSLQNRAIENDIRASLTQLAIQTSDSIVRLYDTSKDSKVSPSTNSSVLISTMDLRLPTDVSNRNYRIQIVSANSIWTQVTLVQSDGSNITTTNGSLIETTSAAKVVAETLQDPKVTLEHVIPNIAANIQGFSENGLHDKLKYYRVNFNGTVTDTIVLGDSTLWIDLRTVS